MPVLDKPGDIPIVKTGFGGFSVSEAAIQAINHMLRTSIVTARSNGDVVWTACLDGTEMTLVLDRRGRVIGGSYCGDDDDKR